MEKREMRLNLPADDVAVEPGGSIFFVGTATTIIRLNNFTILTDPNFLHAGSHVHLGYGLVAKRLTEPAMNIEQLPPLDLCLLSHMHGDHWDKVASDGLRKDLPIITTKTATARLRAEGFTHTVGLSTWQSIHIQKGADSWLRITSMPGKHGPGVMNILLPKVMGSMIEVGWKSDVIYRIYISGDTLLHKDLGKIARAFSDIDMAVMHLGGTRAFGILVTMDADQGVRFLQIVQPKEAIPIHYDDYSVFKSPLDDFVRAVNATKLDTRITYLARGDVYELPISRIGRGRQIA